MGTKEINEPKKFITNSGPSNCNTNTSFNDLIHSHFNEEIYLVA